MFERVNDLKKVYPVFIRLTFKSGILTALGERRLIPMSWNFANIQVVRMLGGRILTFLIPQDGFFPLLICVRYRGRKFGMRSHVFLNTMGKYSRWSFPGVLSMLSYQGRLHRDL